MSVVSDAVKTAERVLREHWDRKIPVDPVQIASALGVAVMADPSLVGSWSGHYSPRGLSGKPLIVYNPQEARVRQRFTVAHELGHHVLGHGERDRDTPKDFNSACHAPEEVAANFFAAALLMPEDSVNACVKVGKITRLDALARTFDVSRAAMKIRLENLGYVVR